MTFPSFRNGPMTESTCENVARQLWELRRNRTPGMIAMSAHSIVMMARRSVVKKSGRIIFTDSRRTARNECEEH